VGDFLDLRLVFRHDGRVISELEESPIRLRAVLSFRDANLEGFDKLMQGAEAGEKRSARITLSEEAETKELRGEEVDVEIEVRDVKQIRLPELTREFLELLGNFENEGEFRSAVRAALERQLEYRQNQTIRQQIANLLTESAGWALPPELLQRQAERELQRAIMELRSSGFSDEQIRAHANTLRQDSRKATARALKEHFILERIAEDQGIEPDDQDYTMEISLMAHQSNESPRSIRARIEKRGLMDALRNQIVERKTIELIKSHARFKDTPLKLAEERTSAVDFAIGGARVTDIPEAKHGGDERGLPQPVDHT
jgi:trigger factor